MAAAAPTAALVLLGPTASGKSALALALAERLPVEIVSLDSAQVYRGMDIGTAKPAAAERSRVPHHLIDLVDPDQSYSAGRWREDAVRVTQEILARGRLPVLVGGTMLYYRALVQGLDALPPADPAVRAQIDAEAAERGWPALHAELAKVDPATAQRIPPTDPQRIQRALEVWRITGRPLSSQHGKTPASLPFEIRAFARMPSREELHANIEKRFDAMLQQGFVDEVRHLRTRYRLTADMPSMRAVGYRQVWEYLEGAVSREEMRSRAIAATRQLAKRQMTWLRSFPGLLRLDAGGGHGLAVGLELLLDVGAQALGRARA
ncbi:MAG TPA: tRNA (adenosine(37)-N6)-dimethylallyltransferase MiaA [Burkholderiales bacterium]|nr:tRNA (adenosine(37)-N6)-dimethylallyltransferase MiaA [Burkholderiales bacterium]